MIEAGKKLTVRARAPARREGRQGAQRSGRGSRRPVHRRGHRTIPRPARSIAEAGDEITAKSLTALIEAGLRRSCRCSTSTTSISAPTSATRSRSTRTPSREEALFDIYRVMRPGEPPTLDTARGDVPFAVLRSRALRPLGGRPREDEHAPRPRRRRHGAHAAQGGHPRGGARRSSTCATAAARSTTSTISATAACARSAS